LRSNPAIPDSIYHQDGFVVGYILDLVTFQQKHLDKKVEDTYIDSAGENIVRKCIPNQRDLCSSSLKWLSRRKVDECRKNDSQLPNQPQTVGQKHCNKGVDES